MINRSRIIPYSDSVAEFKIGLLTNFIYPIICISSNMKSIIMIDEIRKVFEMANIKGSYLAAKIEVLL